MTNPAFEVISRLKGKTLGAAESCTGGGIGNALTAVPGASAVFKGGIISYCNEIKERLLGVSPETLKRRGAVSAQVALEMAKGARIALNADIGISVTGLAGPDGDDYGNPVGTVFIGYEDAEKSVTQVFHFRGSREEIRTQAVEAALLLILEENK